MKCEKCGKEFSDKVYRFHIVDCVEAEPIEKDKPIEQPIPVKNKGGRPKK